jgi:hypothetical protein
MNQKTMQLAFGMTAVLAIALAPVLVSQVNAVPAPKQDPSCSDPKFADRDSCPGKSEDATGGGRDDECTARNKGQSDESCNDAIVNPP